MIRKTSLKITNGVIVLLLLFFGKLATALAEQSWDRASFGTKSMTGNTLEKMPSRTGTQIKSTNLGMGSRIEKTSPMAETQIKSTNLGMGSRIEKTSPMAETQIKSTNLKMDSPVENFPDNPGSTLEKGTSYVTTSITNLSTQIRKFTGLCNKKIQEITHAKTNQGLKEKELRTIIITSKSTEVPRNKEARNLLNSGQPSDIFQNFALLNEALKKIEIDIYAVISIRGDVYFSNGSLLQKDTVIVTKNQIKNGLKNPHLNGKIIFVKQIEIQKSSY